MAKVIWAADEQNGRFLRRRNSLVSLRILLRCSSSNSAILLILASKALSPRAARLDVINLPANGIYFPTAVNGAHLLKLGQE